MSGHKFKKKNKASQDIPTAALPDIVFMLLFFFMVTTVFREDEIKLKQQLPQATQLIKIEKKSLVNHIYIGEPNSKYVSQYGTEPRIQTNDVIIDEDEIPRFVNACKDKVTEKEKDQLTWSLKVDNEVKMGIITDVQEKLRNCNARKVLYNTPPRAPE